MDEHVTDPFLVFSSLKMSELRGVGINRARTSSRVRPERLCWLAECQLDDWCRLKVDEHNGRDLLP